MADDRTEQNNRPQYVVLLHGLARTKRSFKRLENSLIEHGYQVVNVGYPSTKMPIEQLADEAISKALARCQDAKQIHFVTHSMGGILLRQYLKQHTMESLARVVMLGPPNHGSEVVDVLKNVVGFKFINGPAGLQLGTDSHSLVKQLGPATFELGVIAGTRSVNLLLSTLLPRPNDGKVSVESTRLEGMSQHLQLPVTHSFMMQNRQVITHVLHFLKHGSFS